jgi:hypothetical protein
MGSDAAAGDLILSKVSSLRINSALPDNLNVVLDHEEQLPPMAKLLNINIFPEQPEEEKLHIIATHVED